MSGQVVATTNPRIHIFVIGSRYYYTLILWSRGFQCELSIAVKTKSSPARTSGYKAGSPRIDAPNAHVVYGQRPVR